MRNSNHDSRRRQPTQTTLTLTSFVRIGEPRGGSAWRTNCGVLTCSLPPQGIGAQQVYVVVGWGAGCGNGARRVTNKCKASRCDHSRTLDCFFGRASQETITSTSSGDPYNPDRRLLLNSHILRSHPPYYTRLQPPDGVCASRPGRPPCRRRRLP